MFIIKAVNGGCGVLCSKNIGFFLMIRYCGAGGLNTKIPCLKPKKKIRKKKEKSKRKKKEKEKERKKRPLRRPLRQA